MLISPLQLFCYGLAVAGTIGIIGALGLCLYLWFLVAIAPPALPAVNEETLADD